jgi:hypothetical protein
LEVRFKDSRLGMPSPGMTSGYTEAVGAALVAERNSERRERKDIIEILALLSSRVVGSEKFV